MSDKIKPRQHRPPKTKKVVGLRAGHDPRIVPLRIRDDEEEFEQGFNVGHTAQEEWR